MGITGRLPIEPKPCTLSTFVARRPAPLVQTALTWSNEACRYACSWHSPEEWKKPKQSSVVPSFHHNGIPLRSRYSAKAETRDAVITVSRINGLPSRNDGLPLFRYSVKEI